MVGFGAEPDKKDYECAGKIAISVCRLLVRDRRLRRNLEGRPYNPPVWSEIVVNQEHIARLTDQVIKLVG